MMCRKHLWILLSLSVFICQWKECLSQRAAEMTKKNMDKWNVNLVLGPHILAEQQDGRVGVHFTAHQMENMKPSFTEQVENRAQERSHLSLPAQVGLCAARRNFVGVSGSCLCKARVLLLCPPVSRARPAVKALMGTRALCHNLATG
ncbi:hypothetical protein CapIbe_022088 [Capra ibex]